MDLLDLQLDLNIEASSSSNSTPASATRSAQSRKKNETPTTSKTTPKQKWTSRFNSTSNTDAEEPSGTPTAHVATPVNADSPNVTDSGRRARTKNFKRFSPTPQAQVVKKKLNLSTPKADEINGEVTYKAALKNTSEGVVKLGIVEFSIDKTWSRDLKPSEKCQSFIRSSSSSDSKKDTKPPKVSTPTASRTLSTTPRSSHRKITPNARFPAVNQSPSTKSTKLSKDHVIQGDAKKIEKTEEVQDSDGEEVKSLAPVTRRRHQSSMPIKTADKTQKAQVNRRNIRGTSEPRFEPEKTPKMTVPPNICRTRQGMKSAERVKKAPTSSENVETPTSTPAVVRTRKASSRLSLPTPKSDGLMAERTPAAEQLAKAEEEVFTKPSPVVRTRKSTVRPPILKLNLDKKSAERSISPPPPEPPTSSNVDEDNAKPAAEEPVFAEPSGVAVNRRRSSTRSSVLRNSTSEDPPLSPLLKTKEAPPEVVEESKVEVRTRSSSVRPSTRQSISRDFSVEKSPIFSALQSLGKKEEEENVVTRPRRSSVRFSLSGSGSEGLKKEVSLIRCAKVLLEEKAGSSTSKPAESIAILKSSPQPRVNGKFGKKTPVEEKSEAPVPPTDNELGKKEEVQQTVEKVVEEPKPATRSSRRQSGLTPAYVPEIESVFATPVVEEKKEVKKVEKPIEEAKVEEPIRTRRASTRMSCPPPRLKEKTPTKVALETGTVTSKPQESPSKVQVDKEKEKEEKDEADKLSKIEVAKRKSRSSTVVPPAISVREASPRLEDEANVRRSARARTVTDKVRELSVVAASVSKSPNSKSKSPTAAPIDPINVPINPKSALAIRQRLATNEIKTTKERRSLVRKAESEEVQDNGPKKMKMGETGKKEPVQHIIEGEVDEIPLIDLPSQPKVVDKSSVDYLYETLEASKSPESGSSTEESVEMEVSEPSSESVSEPAEPISEPVPVVFQEKKSSPAKSPSKPVTKKPVVTPFPIRVSNRVSKPNKLFTEDYDVQKVARTTLSKSNEVVSTSEPTSESKSSVSSPTLSVSKVKLRVKLGDLDVTQLEAEREKKESEVEIGEKKSASVEIEEPLVRNGVLVGYIPSVKPILGYIETNGVIEPIGLIIESVVDQLLFDVCGDGVEKHSDIINAPARRYSKSTKKDAVEKRARFEAKRLEINMTSMMSPSYHQPSVEVETVKRRRHAPKQNEDFMYTSLKKPKELSKQFDRESTDLKDPDYEYDDNEWRQQEARDYLSETMSKEMEDAIAAETQSSSRDTSNFESRHRDKKKEKKKFISLTAFMKERNVMNRPDCGIKLYDDTGMIAKNDDFFFHEFLTDYPEPEDEEMVDVEETHIDIETASVNDNYTVEQHLNILLKCHGDSIATADRIEMLMARKLNHDGTQFTLEDMLERAAEQPEQRRKLLYNAMTIVKRQYVLESTPPARPYNYESVLFNTTNANANKLKNIFTMFDLPQKESVFWVHKFLVEELPVHFLAAYLALLKYAKPMTSSYIGHIVKSTIEDGYPWEEMTQLIIQHVSIKPNDPELDALNMTITPGCLDDVVFLIASPTLLIGDFHNKPRAPETIFKWLKQMGHSQSELIRAKDDEDYESNVAEFVADNLLDIILEKIEKKRQALPSNRIVLVGFGWTTYVCHRAVNLTSGVSAVISLGFPVLTEEGRRGIPDDDILITYCPTLFVVGAESEYYDSIAMKDMRSSMINPSGLVVIGHANDQLLVSPTVLVRLGVTQKVVYRLILENILEFLELEETKWERTKLCPNELNNIFEVDPILYRSEKLQMQAGLLPSPAASLTPSAISVRRSTISVVDDPVRAAAQPLLKKKKPELSLNSPSIDRARLQFSESMKTAKVSDSANRTMSLDSQRGRGDLRERSLTTPVSISRVPLPKPILPPPMSMSSAPSPSSASPLLLKPSYPTTSTPSSSSKGPIDPASISLV